MQHNTIEFTNNIRSIYLGLNKNYTKYLKLDCLRSEEVDLKDIFHESLVQEYLIDEKAVKILNNNPQSRESLDFSKDFDFKAVEKQKKYGANLIIDQIKKSIIQKRKDNHLINMVSLGIGDGSGAVKYARKLDFENGDKLTGYDLHQTYLKKAKEKIINLETHCVDLNKLSPDCRLSCKDNSVDIVECTMVAHHIEDFNNLIIEIKRILKPAGCFFYLDLIDKTICERKMLFMHDHKYPPFHGVEFFRDKETIKNITRKHLNLDNDLRIGPGILLLSAVKG